MESMNFLIKPLDSTNYATWCSDIKILLLDRDCWDIVAEREAAPVVKEGDEIDARKFKEFNLRFNRAYTTIYMIVSPQYRTIIEGLTNGAEAWKKLKSHFQPDSRARVMALKHEFFSTVIEPDESIGLYSSKLSRIIEQLREAGHPVEDLDQCFQPLRYLPTEYENIIQTVYRWEDKDFKFPKVLEEMLAEEARLRQRATDQVKVSMVSKSVWKSDPERSRISRSQRSSRKEIKFKSGNTKQPSRKKVSQDSVPNRHTSSEVRTSYLLEAFSSSDEGGWIFDSAVTTHFCRVKDLFSKFEQPNASWSSGQYNYSNKSRFQKRAERFLDRKIKCIRTDNGLEFINEQFHNFCDELGIKHERTNIYTPQQNGVSERFNYTAVDGINVLLKDSGLGQGFWSEDLLHFVYTWNRICHSNQCKTPFELYGGKQPSIKHLKPFGCKAFIHIPKQLRKKLDMRSKSGILVGYTLQTKGYRIWLPEARKVIETINVRFNESTPVNLDSNNHKFERVEAVLDPDYVKNKIPLRTASYIDNNEIVLHKIDRESKSSLS
ncbi:Retrovirus-related Pol polyprotein from transposon TNT 1-94 [Araneus ventricosus]|uniref:Retrovirus-related Pol polyprotein from transposon TNT 1-94 n=1 Tax=Araneus ventricosus TaxID=182803 RepID=A0A4Y2SX27_ARAVE|nr:Retrovirus-related Pol polyprotein from transposon TNT 1-94 [Araneus ventricosus]